MPIDDSSSISVNIFVANQNLWVVKSSISAALDFGGRKFFFGEWSFPYSNDPIVRSLGGDERSPFSLRTIRCFHRSLYSSRCSREPHVLHGELVDRQAGGRP